MFVLFLFCLFFYVISIIIVVVVNIITPDIPALLLTLFFMF